MTASIPANEDARLARLGSLRVVDTLPEAEFDDLVQVASVLLDVPIAFLSFVGRDRQWMKAKVGMDVCETPREIAFCAHTILQTEPLVIPDATLDERFSENPLVTGDFHVRFYAGAPLVVDGLAVGTLCCVDTEPRDVSERQISGLSALARQASALLSARQRASQFAESEKRFVTFLDNAPTVAFLKDEEGRIQFANRYFEETLGGEPGSMLGLTAYQYMPKESAEAVTRHDDIVRRTGSPMEVEDRVPFADGTPRIWQSFRFPVEVEGARWVGGVAIDVTRLREAEAEVRNKARELEIRNKELSGALEEAEAAGSAAKYAAARFEQLFAGLPVACYTFDKHAMIQEWNSAAEALWEVPSQDTFLTSMYGTAVCEANWDAQQEIARRVFSGESIHGSERMETLRNGKERWILSNTFPLRNSQGVVVGAVSANVDVTERKLAEGLIREKEERFRTVVESLQEGLVVQDTAGRIVFWNRNAERTLGMNGFQMASRSSMDEDWKAIQTDGSDFPSEAHPIVRALATGFPQEPVTMGIHRPDGELRWLCVTAAPVVPDRGGLPTSAVASFLDVTDRIEQDRFIEEQMHRISAYSAELEDANARLEALATSDGLTGLKNHRYFQDELRQEIERSRRTGEPLSIALLDVDWFKAFNDDFGHQEGDAVLRGVAAVLTETTRACDVVARYGGEEFVVVMPGASAAEALAGAERLRAALEAWPFPLRPVTASVGVATLSMTLSDAASLIRAADEALYRSKSAGRNQVTHWSDLATDLAAA